MRDLKRLGLAVIFAAAAAAPAFGQGGSSSTTGGASIGTGGGSSSSSGGLAGTSSGSSGSTSSTTGGTTVGAITANTSTTNTNTAISSSNFLAPNYGAVYYQGRAGASITQAPGGFGQVLYSAGGATGGGQIPFAGAAGVTSTSAAGGRGKGGSSNLISQGGIVAQLPKQISYSAQIRFQAPPLTPVMLQTDLQGVIDRSVAMDPSAGKVQVTVEGNGVILRGRVRDEDEASLIEGMVRLTPGVGAIKNELSYPR